MAKPVKITVASMVRQARKKEPLVGLDRLLDDAAVVASDNSYKRADLVELLDGLRGEFARFKGDLSQTAKRGDQLTFVAIIKTLGSETAKAFLSYYLGQFLATFSQGGVPLPAGKPAPELDEPRRGVVTASDAKGKRVTGKSKRVPVA